MTNQALHDHLIGENGNGVFLNKTETSKISNDPFTFHPIGKPTLDELAVLPNKASAIRDAIDNLLHEGVDSNEALEVLVHDNEDAKTVTFTIPNAQIDSNGLIESAEKTFQVAFTISACWNGYVTVTANSEEEAEREARDLVEEASSDLSHYSFDADSAVLVDGWGDVDVDIEYVSEA